MDINGGQLTQTNGNPIWPAATSTGPLVAGNIPHGDGVSALAGAGEQVGGVANAGYAVMAQFSAVLTQAATASAAVTTQIVIPAQSMIVSMTLLTTTAWASSATITVADTGSNTYVTTQASPTVGAYNILPQSKANTLLWQTVGSTDSQLTVASSGGTGGQGVLVVRYIQGCNAAVSA